MIPARTDVLIVGAGPTGLMLANQLARRGVRPTIIDRHAGPARETRALGVQARTLEIYSQLGIADKAVALGTPAAGATISVNGRRAARVPLGEIGRGLSPFPFLLILGQDDNELLLGEALRSRGLDVEWNTELVALEHDSAHVSTTLKRGDGSTVSLEARWVAGCDGAHSAVRRLNGIEFRGAPYEQVFFVADTRATGPMAREEFNVYLWRSGFHLFFPLRGDDHWRLVGMLPPELRGRDDLDFATVLPAVLDEVGPGFSFQECRWFSPYRIHHRRAERFRERRCFLLGDAAHIHSPVGAQGMNTGLQDAYNLAWKLALVASGRADDALLDSYEAERVPVAERLLDTTDRAFSFLVSGGWLPGTLRTLIFPRVLALVMSTERTRRFAFQTISQIGIRYPRSPLSSSTAELPAGAPRPGDRFPWLRLHLAPGAPAEDLFSKLDDTAFHLIAIGQPAAVEAGGSLLRTLLVPDDPANDAELRRAAIPKPSFYLLRPDGHVGLAGTRVDPATVSRYLTERVGLSASARVG